MRQADFTYLIDLDDTLISHWLYANLQKKDALAWIEAEDKDYATDCMLGWPNKHWPVQRERYLQLAPDAHTLRYGSYPNQEFYTISLRDGVETFLAELNRNGNVLLFTAAELEYAKDILDVFGLEDFFQDVYSLRTHRTIPVQGERWVLVDDSQAQEKLEMLPMRKRETTEMQRARHLISVTPASVLEEPGYLVGKLPWIQKRREMLCQATR